MKNCRSRKTEDKLYDALVKLMGTLNYREINITDISAEADVSRMTFYRHFKDKDDIMIRHLKNTLSDLEKEMKSRRNLTRKEFWLEFFRVNLGDSLNERTIQAGLFKRAFKILCDFVINIYQTCFDLDLRDENGMALVHRKLGSVFGYLYYMGTHPNYNKDLMNEHIVALAENRLPDSCLKYTKP